MNSWFSGETLLTWQDYSVLLVLVIGSMFLGIWLGRKEDDTRDFFLGGRQIPWWAAMLSLVATEISALTIIGVPAISYMQNWEYVQFFIGSFFARIVIAYLFIPAFYKFNCTSIYEFLRHRFGPETQYAGSVLFFITRLLASGVRLMAASVAVSVLIGWHLIPTIILFSIVSMIYISWGGIKAVIWTNVIQALTFIIGGIIAIFFILSRIDGGLDAVFQIAGEAGRLQAIDWGPVWAEAPGLRHFLTEMFKNPNVIWIAILNGLVGSMAAFGTDQELMQRLLTVETREESQKTMMFTTIGSLIVLLTFLSIGSLLFTFYQQNAALALPEKLDAIFPHFITFEMPVYMRGLLLAAIVMASIDSPLGSLTSSFVMDFYKPLIAKEKSEKHYLFVSRVSIIVFGLLLGIIAYYFSHLEQFLWLAFKISGVTYGSLLGAFLLGLLTKKKVNRANVVGMGVTAVLMLLLLYLSENKMIPLGWSYLVLIGTGLTFLIGWIFGEDEKNQLQPTVN